MGMGKCAVLHFGRI